jgi:hypothetical protein
MKVAEEDRLLLHDLRGVNVKVDFFLGSREDLGGCLTYSLCWEKIDLRLDIITIIEQISELEFWSQAHQLFIDDHVISGDVIDFRWEPVNNFVHCKILVGSDK